jgi:hypothetical protein
LHADDNDEEMHTRRCLESTSSRSRGKYALYLINLIDSLKSISRRNSNESLSSGPSGSGRGIYVYLNFIKYYNLESALCKIRLRSATKRAEQNEDEEEIEEESSKPKISISDGLPFFINFHLLFSAIKIVYTLEKPSRGDQVFTLAHGVLIAVGPASFKSFDIPLHYTLVSIRNNLVTENIESMLREKKFKVFLILFYYIYLYIQIERFPNEGLQLFSSLCYGCYIVKSENVRNLTDAEKKAALE